MLENLKLMLDITNNTEDKKLQYILDTSQRKILTIIHCDTEITAELEDIIIELAIYRYNLLGVEGLKSEQFNGVNNNYCTDIPDYIYNQLIKFKKARFI